MKLNYIQLANKNKTKNISLECVSFLQMREYSCSRKRHLETPIFLCHEIKDGAFNNKNINQQLWLKNIENCIFSHFHAYLRKTGPKKKWLVIKIQNSKSSLLRKRNVKNVSVCYCFFLLRDSNYNSEMRLYLLKAGR